MMLWFAATALASGLLVGDDSYGTLQAMTAEVVVDGRVVSAVVRYDFAPSEARSFVALIPDEAAVTGLRLRDDEGWVEAVPTANPRAPRGPDGLVDGLLEGNLFSAAMPQTEGSVTIELRWQEVVAATRGALSVSLPLDDGGLGGGDPVVHASFAVVSPMLSVNPSPDLGWSVDRLGGLAAWEGSLDDAEALVLGWEEVPAGLGVGVWTFRPEVDPWTGVSGAPGYGLIALRAGPEDPAARVDQLFSFVLDASESMEGAPLRAAVRAASSWLRALGPDDRFNVVPYTSQAVPFAGRSPHATQSAVARAVGFLQKQDARGLSDPEEALRTTLALMDDTAQGRGFFGCGGTARATSSAPPLPGQPVRTADGEEVRVAPYVVWVTDGGATSGVTGAGRIGRAVSDANAVGASVFAIGVGRGADRELLDRVTASHRGEARYVDGVGGIEAAVSELRERISHPQLVRPVVTVAGSHEVAPAVLSDVSAGSEVLLAFRYVQTGEARVRLRAIRGRGEVDRRWELPLPNRDEALPSIALAWAQLMVADLDGRYAAGDRSLWNEISWMVETYGVASEVVSLGFDRSNGEETSAMKGYETGEAGCGCASVPAPVGSAVLVLLWPLLRRRRRIGTPPHDHG